MGIGRSLDLHRRDWEDLGILDPCWAVLIDPGRKFGRWNLEEFFRTGQHKVEEVMTTAGRLGCPRQRDLALDFGCGIGRLTRALAKHFIRCYGVDISESMIAKAQELNRSVANCEFLVNRDGHLGAFPDDHFDLVCTFIVLQHLPSRRAIKDCIAELVRVVRPNGLVTFQVPSRIPLKRRFQPRRRLYGLLRRVGFPRHFLYGTLRLFPIPMTAVPEPEVLAFVESIGGSVLEVRHDDSASKEIPSRAYYVTKA